MKKTIFLFLICLVSSYATGQSLIVRSEASVGYMTTFDDNHSIVQNYGGKVLFGITEKQRFGLKLDYMNTDFNNVLLNREYVGIGLVLEQVLFKYFNMGIGTVGYVPLNGYKEHSPFGVYTHLGFEYTFDSGLILLAAYQTDFIFNTRFGINNAFKVGVGYRIDFKKH